MTVPQPPITPPPGFPVGPPQAGPPTGPRPVVPSGTGYKAPRQGVTKVAVTVVTLGAVLVGGAYALGMTPAPAPPISLSSADGKPAVTPGDQQVFVAAETEPAAAVPVQPVAQPAVQPPTQPVRPAPKIVRRAPVVVADKPHKTDHDKKDDKHDQDERDDKDDHHWNDGDKDKHEDRKHEDEKDDKHGDRKN